MGNECTKRVELSVHLTRGSGDVAVACPLCGLELDLHQPDPGAPTRLVGICETCPAWFFLVDCAGRRETVAIQLPMEGLPAAGAAELALRPVTPVF